MEEKEILEALAARCQEDGVFPCRIAFSLDDCHGAKAENDDPVQKTSEQKTELYAEGLVDGRKGFYRVSGIKLEEVKAEDISAGIKDTAPDGEECKPEWFPKPAPRLGKSESFSTKLSSVPADLPSDSVEKMRAKIKSFDFVFSASYEVRHWLGRTAMAVCSNGVLASQVYKRDGYSLDLTITSGSGKKSFRQSSHQSIHRNLDGLDEESFALQAINSLKAKMAAVPVEPGKRTVVFAPQPSGALLSAFGCHLDGNRIYNHQSIFTIDDLGKDVLSPKITFLNDPFVASDYARPFDEEGSATEKFMAVDHGRLRCLFLDCEYGDKLGQKPNGCYSREGCRSQYMVASPSQDRFLKEMLNSAGDYVLINEVKNAKDGINEDTLDFDFEFYGESVSGDKRIPVYGRITGNAFDVLKKVQEVSKERRDFFRCLVPWLQVPDMDIE